jgi:hypothetical protein
MIAGKWWPVFEEHHSLPSSDKTENADSYISTSSYIVMAGYVVKQRDDFTFNLHFYSLLKHQYAVIRISDTDHEVLRDYKCLYCYRERVIRLWCPHVDGLLPLVMLSP